MVTPPLPLKKGKISARSWGGRGKKKRETKREIKKMNTY
jgi:hypothetical protein